MDVIFQDLMETRTYHLPERVCHVRGYPDVAVVLSGVVCGFHPGRVSFAHA